MSNRHLVAPHHHAIGLSCAVALMALLMNLPAYASCDERPSTPIELSAEPLSPTAIRLKWKNTTRGAAWAGAGGHTMYFDIYVRDLYGQDLGRDVTGVRPYPNPNLTYGSLSYHEFGDLNMGTDYCFYMRARTAAGTQGCVSQDASSAVCTATTVPAGSAPNGCKSGFVWRTATPADDVCVDPQVRKQTLADNRLASTRRVGPARLNPDACPLQKSGMKECWALDPDTCGPQDLLPKECWAFDIPCIDPYVWRRATADDYVCVPVQTAQEAASDNARANERRVTVASADALPPPPPPQPDQPQTPRTCSGQLYSQASNVEFFYSDENGCAQPASEIANSVGEAVTCGALKYGDSFAAPSPVFRVATTGPSGCHGFTIPAGSEDKALQCAESQCGVGCTSVIGECP